MQSNSSSPSGSTDHSDNPKFGIGIDFGTSNSAAAVFDGEQVYLVQLSKQNSIMPSANYVDKDYTTTIGQKAIDDYISGNQGRKVELSAELLGEARTSTGTKGHTQTRRCAVHSTPCLDKIKGLAGTCCSVHRRSLRGGGCIII